MFQKVQLLWSSKAWVFWNIYLCLFYINFPLCNFKKKEILQKVQLLLLSFLPGYFGAFTNIFLH